MQTIVAHGKALLSRAAVTALLAEPTA
jgi:hypothetical protein